MHASSELLTREELQRRLRDPSFTVVDVLTREAHAQGHIPGALSLPFAELRELAPRHLPDRDSAIGVYCGSET